MISIIVPSRGRAQRAAQMVQSVRATSTGDVEVIVAIDPDDPELAAYQRKVPGVRVLPERIGYSGTLNAIAREVWDRSDILGAFGDDVLFRTPGWDDRIRDALATPGLAFGDDLAHGAVHPTAVFMSSAIARALDYLALPRCRHQYVDNAWWELGTALGVLRYVPEVVIEHMHVGYGKADWDATYREVYSQPQAGIDHAAFLDWKETGLEADAARARAAL